MMAAMKRMGMWTFGAVAVAVGVLLVAMPGDPLSGLDSNHQLSYVEIQALATTFCFSPAIPMLMKERVSTSMDESEPVVKTVEDGDLNNDEYVQSSIYAILYALYQQMGNLTSEHGIEYQFTFNTWGFSLGDDHPYNHTDPQRHGKAAYRGLVTQPPVLDYINSMPEAQRLRVVEIGCGTAAGANLITREVHPTADYLALDMQAQAIDTCKRIHATDDNPGLECKLVPNGVGNGGNQAPVPDSSVDVVVISETHIADVTIGDLEKEIFGEIKRILKPNGLFVWGNALPTHVWHEARPVLKELGFELANEYNHTAGAIQARDEDFARVELVLEQMLGFLHVMKLPYIGNRCHIVTKKLIANFFRHPGTMLYKTMLSGWDSYMHQAWQISK